MKYYSLGVMESKFADIVWEAAPFSTKELIKKCEEAFGWKRTTTYTVLKNLHKKGLFKNDNGTVRVCIDKKEFLTEQSQRFVDESFGGSLADFLDAFAAKRKLSGKEIKKIKKIIEKNA